MDGYGEQRSGWLWPIVMLVCCVMLCGTLVFGGYVALQLAKPVAPAPLVTPSPISVSPEQPLVADPQRAALTQGVASLLAGSESAGDIRDTLWGLAVAIDRSRQTLTSPQQVTALIQKAGAITFGGRSAIAPAQAQQLDQLLLAELGTDPSRLTDQRRNGLIAALRAMAYGAHQAAGG